MGLFISHNCWKGAYSAFARWRHRIAERAGYAVWQVVMDDRVPRDTVMVDWGHLQGHLLGFWEETPPDPLLVLIVHADDEGCIYPMQARPLAERLDALDGLYPDTARFVFGLRCAASKGEAVTFGSGLRKD